MKINQEAENLRANMVRYIKDENVPALENLLRGEIGKFQGLLSADEKYDFYDMTANLMCMQGEGYHSVIWHIIAKANHECLRVVHTYMENLKKQLKKDEMSNVEDMSSVIMFLADKLKAEDFLFDKDLGRQSFVHRADKKSGIIRQALAIKIVQLPYKYYSQGKEINKEEIEVFVRTELKSLLSLDEENRKFYGLDQESLTKIISKIFTEGEKLAKEWVDIENQIRNFEGLLKREEPLSRIDRHDFFVKFPKGPWQNIILDKIRVLEVELERQKEVITEYSKYMGIGVEVVTDANDGERSDENVKGKNSRETGNIAEETMQSIKNDIESLALSKKKGTIRSLHNNESEPEIKERTTREYISYREIGLEIMPDEMKMNGAEYYYEDIQGKISNERVGDIEGDNRQQSNIKDQASSKKEDNVESPYNESKWNILTKLVYLFNLMVNLIFLFFIGRKDVPITQDSKTKDLNEGEGSGMYKGDSHNHSLASSSTVQSKGSNDIKSK
jgi:hypothetical protein